MKRHYLLHRIYLASLALLAAMTVTSCNEKNEINGHQTSWDIPADHTLLMYLVGDNNLSSDLEANVRDAQSALLDSVQAGMLNLVVMKDNDHVNDSYPSLYWVHRNAKEGLDTVMLRKWDEEVNTADPEFLAEILKLTFSRFDTRIKGLTLGSHASGWVPLKNNNLYSTSPQRRAFGIDDKNNPVASIELWDLAAALRKGPKLNYVMMDCCHMSSAEVAYEMRDVADYMVACPTEEEGSGLPYRQMIPALSRCTSADELPKVLDYCAHAYFNYINTRYRTGATIALIDLRKVTQLADAYQRLLAPNADRLALYAEADGEQIDAWLKNFQRYGREEQGIHYKYYFMDILSVIDWLGAVDASAAQEARQAVQQCVLSSYATAMYRGIELLQCSGMAVTLPEVLHLARRSSGYSGYFTPFDELKLTTGYHLTAWGAKMGY